MSRSTHSGKWLELLFLDSQHFTENGIRHLAAATQLHSLSLKNCTIGDGLAALPLGQLVWLDLKGARIDSDSLNCLNLATRLVYLGLDGTTLGDDMLGAVARIPRLERLSINRTKVTAAGLTHLRSSQSLRFVHVLETSVTSADAKGFSKQHGAMRVFAGSADQNGTTDELE